MILCKNAIEKRNDTQKFNGLRNTYTRNVFLEYDLYLE